MSGDYLDKIQCYNEDAATDVERVYGINEIVPDQNVEAWGAASEMPRKASLMKMIAAQFNDPESSDVEVEVGDEAFKVIMIVLQSYSTFFRERSNSEKVIKLSVEHITPNVFFKIYQWMWSSKTVERDGLIPLLLGAQYLQVVKLEQQIWNLIQDGGKFQESEAFLLYLEAKLWKFEKIIDMMMSRVQRFFMTFVASEDFLLLDAHEVQKWLKLDTIGINTEIEVFYCAARWMLHDWDERKKYLMDLVRLVRFGLIAPWRIVEYRMNKNTGKLAQILEEQELQPILESSLSYSTYRNCFPDESSEQFTDFLSRFGFQRLYSRDFMIDEIWQVNFKDSRYTYEDFCNYLNFAALNKNWMNNVIVSAVMDS